MNVKRLSKRTLATLLSVLLLLSTLVVGTVTTTNAVENEFTPGSKLYLKPNADWLNDNAKFVAYFFNSENGDSQNEWVEMKQVSNDTSAYEVTVPSANTYDRVNFARYNPSVSTYNWTDSRPWNQTKVQAKADGNMCVITDDKDGDDYAPYWKNYINIASNTVFYFDNSVVDYSNVKTANSSKLRVLFVTEDSHVYVSGGFSSDNIVSNSNKLINRNIGNDLSSYTSWSNVKSIMFVQMKNTTSASTSGLKDYSDFFDNNDSIKTDVVNKYTGSFSNNFVTSSGTRCLFVPSENNGDPLTGKILGTGNSALNFDQNIKVIIDGTYSTSNASVTANYYYQSSQSGTSEGNYTADNSNAFKACYFTNVSLTATPNSGYSFGGFYSDNECTQSVNSSYTVYSENTIYAKFTSSGSSEESTPAPSTAEPSTEASTPAPTAAPTEAATESEEAGTFNFYAEGTHQTKTSKIFFERPGGDWATEGATNKVFILLYTDDSIYSVKLDKVDNALLNSRSARSIMDNAQNVNSNLTWTDITDIAFIELEPSNSHPSSHFENKELVNGVSYSTTNKSTGETTDHKFSGFSAGTAVNAETAADNGIACYTAKYSTAISDGGQVKYHYFTPATTDNGSTVNKTTLDKDNGPYNLAQNVYVPNYGGSVSIVSYVASNSEVKSQNNSDAIYNSSNTPVNFNAAYTSTVTLTATPFTNYLFGGWYSNQECTTQLSSKTTYTYTVRSDNNVYAKFTKSDGSDPDVRTIAVNTPENGSVSAKANDSSQNLPYIGEVGTSVTLTAYPDAGYKFDGFYNEAGTEEISTDNPYTYTISENKTFTAKFSLKSNTNLTQTASVIGTGGAATVSGDGNTWTSSISVASGTSVKFKAAPAEGYEFYGWYTTSTGSGMPLSSEAEFTFTAYTANTLYAKFASEKPNADSSDNALKNNKSRKINATSLSAQAQAYYQNEAPVVSDTYKNSSGGVYQTFLNLSTAESNDSTNSYDVAQDNSLYTALYDIMSSTHTHGVSYPAYGNNSLAHYWLTTDTSAENAADARGVYTLFYSDADCYNHKDMQREHIWPKSKASFLMKTGLGGSDLHHLRPAYGKLNLLKLNWGFASIQDGSDWINTRTLTVPETNHTSLWRAEKNGETFIDVKKDVRGDVARILLYIYTRWKQPNLYSDIVDSEGNPDSTRLPELDPDDKADSGERIIYDLPTLLEWMEEDPVSEWEMKRNDLTQDVQGNRNVFIDYPELAWLIFDKNNDLPKDMDTPSGMARKTTAEQITSTDMEKNSDSRTYNDKIALDFETISGNGAAEITAYNNTTGKAVKNGDIVDRGDNITYTIIPDQSTIGNIKEFSSDESSSSNTIVNPETDKAYSFTKQAGYYSGSANIAYKKDRIQVSLSSGACEVSIKVNSKTSSGGSGGSGSGMVVVRTGATTIIESGDTVANGAKVNLTLTPDYGSRFYGLTYGGKSINIDGTLTSENSYTATGEISNQTYTLKKINGTESYSFTTTLDCSGSTTREKKFTVYFAQTFNAGNGDPEKPKHINNKGMRPNSDDPMGLETDFTGNFEICGVQKKIVTGEEDNKAMRFVSVIDKDILAKAESYGYVIGKTNTPVEKVDGKNDYKPINRLSYALVKDGANTLTVNCTNTDNTIAGKYGKCTTGIDDTDYKYITVAIHNIQEAGEDTTIVARPYVVLKDDFVRTGAPKVIYGQYVDFSTGENYCSCSTSYSNLENLASAQ